MTNRITTQFTRKNHLADRKDEENDVVVKNLMHDMLTRYQTVNTRSRHLELVQPEDSHRE